ncbi:MAG: cytochrome o ubiquinol oxidase subunit III [Candidatus Malihini olakiniferum]
MTTETLIHQHVDHDAHAAHGHYDASGTKVLGFWVYLMSDLIIFGSLFATYAVLVTGIADGPSGKDLFDLKFVLVETFALLLSSITFGMAIIAMYKGNVARINTWLTITFLFGLVFIGMEFYEFHHLIAEGYGPERSAFLSAFFALIGTHGIHVTSGLIWLIVMMIQVSRWDITPTVKTRLMCLNLFWHFLDVIWICIFTVVYLAGAM